ncbi:right-handed parallel beta-helix repeat-containing protein, partial [bacterium]|nr:right-handed parallel beta-helix repeat-containing protein [bacterium]
CIDRGFGDAGDEPLPNATPFRGPDLGMRNLGAYGGSEQGSKTPQTRYIILLEPVGGESYADRSVPVPVRWEWLGVDWAPGDTLAFEYSADSGATWAPAAGGAAVPFEAGTFAWDINGLPIGLHYRLRAACNQAPGSTDQSDDDFRIGVNDYYYVNDSSTTNDLWCTAAGNDGNDGLSPAAPKATVQAIIDTYDLEPGDTVHIDTGTYALASNITLTVDDQGSPAAPVIFLASPYGVTLDRGDAAGASVWRLDNCSGTAITTATDSTLPAAPQRWMRITGANWGIYLNSANQCTLSRLEVTGNAARGIYANRAADLRCANTLIHGNGYGLQMLNCGDGAIENNTIALNTSHQLSVSSASHRATVRNNILWAHGAGATAFYASTDSVDLASDHNDIHATDGAALSNQGADLAAWRAASGQDANSFSRDPLFVDSAGGDYHLQSTAGSYHGGAWAPDGGDSAGIDAGLGSPDDEPAPNATPLHGPGLGRRNLGAYGGSEQASKTPTARRLVLLEPIGGEAYIDQTAPIGVRWTWTGSAWQAGDPVALTYSPDSGSVWRPVAGADSVAVDAGAYPWDIYDEPGGLHYRARATGAPGAGEDESGSDFRIGLTAAYYVNDASTTSDIWCTAPGDDANDGLTPATPKATVQAVLATYALRPGDAVRIDTGTYSLTSNIVVGEDDQGSSAGPVTFEGSPNGVLMDRGDTAAGSYGWHLDGCDYVTLTRLSVTGADYGVRAQLAHHCTLDRVVLAANARAGLYAYASQALLVSNCIIRANTVDGVFLYNCPASTTRNCSIAANGEDQVTVSYASATLVNNILWADGAGARGISMNTAAALSSDYNDIGATNGASVGYSGSDDQATLADWQAATGQDAHSVSADPLFADAAGGDLRLTAGSPCIDAADGSAAPERDYDDLPRIDDPLTEPNTGAGSPAYADIGAHEHPGGATLHRLTIRSDPVSHVLIIGDAPGRTNHAVTDVEGRVFRLTAPAAVPEGLFDHWQDGAVEAPTATIDVTLDTAKTVVAVYSTAPAAPEALVVDTLVMSGTLLHPNAPACNSLGILSITPGPGPTDTPIAVQIGNDPASGWLRLVAAGARGFDAYADGAAPEPHPASAWAGRRLRGLAPGTDHAFYAKAVRGDEESDLVHVGTYATNPACDVNRSLGDPRPVRGVDFALARREATQGATIGVDQSWACDVDGDGLVTFADVVAILIALCNP